MIQLYMNTTSLIFILLVAVGPIVIFAFSFPLIAMLEERKQNMTRKKKHN